MNNITEFERIVNENDLVSAFAKPEHLIFFQEWLVGNGYFNVPASLNHHGTNEGDLFRHSLKVAEILADYTEKLGLKWQRACSPWIVGLFHDLCKIDNYVANPHYQYLSGVFPEEEKWLRNDKQLLTEHGAKSVMLLSRFMRISEEEMLCIRYHMGAYKTDEWAQFDLAIRKCQNVLYTHTADMAASKIFNI